MNPSEINAAGEAYAPDMTDEATRATWTEDGLRALIDRLRVMYGDEAVARAYYARIESDEPRTVDCSECPGPSEVVDFAPVPDDHKLLRLACGHLIRAGGAS